MIKKITLSATVLLFSACTSTPKKQPHAPIYTPTPVKKTSKKPAVNIFKPTTNKVQTSVILKQQDIAIKPKTQAATSPVVVALLADANTSYQQGHLEESAATIERALRIEPRNASLLYQLANIRLQQGEAELAENLAKKSELLAVGNAALKKKSWLLIAKAREQQNKLEAASAALKKARQF